MALLTENFNLKNNNQTFVNYYKLLGVRPSSTFDEIKAAYKTQVFKWHPDRNPNNQQAPAMMVKINQAYSVLSDANQKKSYDTQFGNKIALELDGPTLPKPPTYSDRQLMAKRGYQICNNCFGVGWFRALTTTGKPDVASSLKCCQSCNGNGFVGKKNEYL